MMSSYVGLTTSLDDVLELLAQSDSGLTVAQKRFKYVAWVTICYASFEQFAEEVSHRFAEISFGQTSDLVALAKLRSSYSYNAGRLLQQPLGEGRFAALDALGLATSLVSVLTDGATPAPMREVSAYHTSNLKLAALAQLFPGLPSPIGELARKRPPLRSWFSALDNPGEDHPPPLATVEARLEDLVGRRNEIAHQGTLNEVVLGSQALETVEFVVALAGGIVLLLTTELLSRTDSVELPMDGEPIKAGRVVLTKALPVPVRVGDSLFARRHDGSGMWGRISSIQIEEENLQSAPQGALAGLGLDFPCASNSTIYRLSAMPDGIYPVPPQLQLG